jgi:ATP-dependent Clp protease ATP-binding subunit ClpA
MIRTDGEFVRIVLRLAQAEAVAAQSPSIEAEHVLLALTSSQGGQARDLLAEAGLDHDAVEMALAADVERSLAQVGVRLAAGRMPRSSFFPGRKPRLGASAKSVLHRTVAAARGGSQNRIEPRHVLVGLLNARVGTVPRALDLAGIDRPALVARALAQ